MKRMVKLFYDLTLHHALFCETQKVIRSSVTRGGLIPTLMKVKIFVVAEFSRTQDKRSP